MFNVFLMVFFLLFSFFLFFINNIYVIVGIFVLFLGLSLVFKIRLRIYKSLLFILLINFLLNYLLGSLNEALIIVLRLFIMFLFVNLLIKKMGINEIGKALGKLFHSETVYLIISLSLGFIPLLMKEITEIKRTLLIKNYSLTFKNIITKPSIFVTTFFINLFKRVNALEKSLIASGMKNF